MNIKLVESILLFFKQRTSYGMRISDWSSDVCSSDLASIWRIAAATAGQPKRGCADVQPLDSDDAIRVIAGVRRDEDIAPQEIAHAIVEEPRRARPHPSLERESSIGRRIQIKIGSAACRERVCQYV